MASEKAGASSGFARDPFPLLMTSLCDQTGWVSRGPREGLRKPPPPGCPAFRLWRIHLCTVANSGSLFYAALQGLFRPLLCQRQQNYK